MTRKIGIIVQKKQRFFSKNRFCYSALTSIFNDRHSDADILECCACRIIDND